MFHAKSWASASNDPSHAAFLDAGVEVSGLLLHKDDVFVHVSHKHGYEGPMLVEEEGFLAGSPLVCLPCRSLGPGLLSRGSALLTESPPCNTDQQCTLRSPARADSLSKLHVVKTGRCGVDN